MSKSAVNCQYSSYEARGIKYANLVDFEYLAHVCAKIPLFVFYPITVVYSTVCIFRPILHVRL